MSSNFQRESEVAIEKALTALIPQVTGFSAGQQNFQIAVKFASSNLKYHQFPDTDRIIVQRKFSGILQKLQILCKPEISTYLAKLFASLQKKKLVQDYPDIHFRVLDLLLGMSGNIVEVNQNKLIPENYPHDAQLIQQDNLNHSDGEWEEVKFLHEWGKFESSSSEEGHDDDDDDVNDKSPKLDNQIELLDQQLQTIQAQSDVQDNFLFHLSNPNRRSYQEFLQRNVKVQVLNAYQLYKPETQNLSVHLHLSRQQEQYSLRGLIKYTEKDIIASILYAFLQQDTDIITSHELTSQNSMNIKYFAIFETYNIKIRGFTLNQDICVTHMSVQAIQNHMEKILSQVNLVSFLKQLTKSQSDHYSNNSSKIINLKREEQVQEAFWSSVNDICNQFDKFIVQLQQRLLKLTLSNAQEMFEDIQNHSNAPLTLLQLDDCLMNQLRLINFILQLSIEVKSFSVYKQDSIFDSPALTLIWDQFNQIGQTDVQLLEPLLRTFLCSLKPYCAMLDNFLDFHNFVEIQESIISPYTPKFIQGVMQELQAMGQGYQIYAKIQSQTPIGLNQQIERTNFSQLMLQNLIEKFNIIVVVQTKDVLDFLEIREFNNDLENFATRDNSASKISEQFDNGPYQMYNESFISGSFNFAKIPEQKQIQQENQNYLLSDVVNDLTLQQMQSFSRVLTKIFSDIIQERHSLTQGKLLSIIYERLNLIEVMKFLRTLYFFERIDVMNFVIEKVSEGSQGLGRLRAFQAQLKESLLEYNVTSKDLVDRFQFCIEFGSQRSQQEQLSLLNPRNFQIKMNLAHPLDLIVDANSLLLYNKIMQMLIFFKNAKFNLQNAHAILKKRINDIQSKKKQRVRLDDESQDQQEPVYQTNQYQMNDEREISYKKKNLIQTRRLIFNMCHFAQEMISFVNSYEYFLFESVISQQTKIFLDNLENQKDFQSIVILHINYLKIIADKIFLNKKTEQILETINVLLNTAQNLPLLVSRISSLEIVDKLTIKIETERAAEELTQMRQNYNKAMQTLIILFDKSERQAYAPEMIEAIFKSNFNRFYQQRDNL